jgi:hypothetical protein
MSVFSRLPFSCVLASIVAVAACAGSDSTEFTGTWTYNTGASGTISCPTGNNTLNLGGNEEFRPGTDSDLVVISSDGCNIKMNINGNHADAIPGQSCSTTQSGVTGTITFNSMTYTSESDVLSFNAAGTINLMGPGGEATCTLAASATLHQVSK